MCSDWSLVRQVLLFAERNKVPGMKRLLEAGGAVVLQNSKLAAGGPPSLKP